nr:U1 small nuclear ribonucleoprotein 70 kDa [Polyrhizophydium stewartii]
MTSFLPPGLLRLFAPRPPLPYLQPALDPDKKAQPKYTSLSSFLPLCAGHDPDYVPSETLDQRKKRLSYETSEKRLKREFEEYGKVVSVRIVRDVKTSKSRGYAFVEFSREDDMKSAARQASGLRIDGRVILCDVERGRTVQDWKPRRLGGGLGKARSGAKPPPEPPSNGASRFGGRGPPGRDYGGGYRDRDGGRDGPRDGGRGDHRDDYRGSRRY